MPRYTYRCKKCEVVFDTRHSMSEDLTDCTECESADTLEKVPSTFVSLNYKANENNKSLKVGQLTNQKIEEFREDLKQQKKELKEETS